MKEKNLIKQIELSVIEKMGIAYCYCKISLDSYGQLEDFIFMESNDYFKDLTGFTKGYIKNKKAKDIRSFESHRINIMKALEKLLLYKEEKMEFEDYFDITKKWVKVLLYTEKKQVFFYYTL